MNEPKSYLDMSASEKEFETLRMSVEFGSSTIKDLRVEIDTLTARLATAEAKCTEMRSVAQENDIQRLLDIIEAELPVSESDGMDEYSKAAWKLCDVVRKYLALEETAQ